MTTDPGIINRFSWLIGEPEDLVGDAQAWTAYIYIGWKSDEGNMAWVGLEEVAGANGSMAGRGTWGWGLLRGDMGLGITESRHSQQGIQGEEGAGGEGVGIGGQPGDSQWWLQMNGNHDSVSSSAHTMLSQWGESMESYCHISFMLPIIFSP